jgi:toxin ParE1/3/4
VKVRFARSAQISFQSALNFINQNNPQAAFKFYDRVEEILRRLEKHPDSGRMIPEFPQLPYREILVPPYRFFYRVEGKSVFIVAVWHTAQIPIEPSK